MSCAKEGTISYNGVDTITSVVDACAKCGIIRWESSTDNINWTIIPNESLQTLSVTPTNTLTYYRRGIAKAKESCKQCKWKYSNVVEVELVGTASITGLTWYDSNGNGRFNTGELGIENVIVLLTNTDTLNTQTTNTNSSGIYLFSNLPSGNYKLTFTPPHPAPNNNTYGITRSNFGTDDSDSDMLTGVNETSIFALADGEVKIDVDAGFTLPNLGIGVTTYSNSFFSPINNFSFRVNVSEGSRAATNGTDIIVRIIKTPFLTINYNSSLTVVSSDSVQNSEWVFSEDLTYWYFTRSGVLPSFGNSAFGVDDGIWDSLETGGVFDLIAEVYGGGDMVTPTLDSEVITYFA